jgi:hypothetical protein
VERLLAIHEHGTPHQPKWIEIAQPCCHDRGISRRRCTHLVYDTHNRLPLKLRAFVDFAVPRMRERLSDAAL